MSHHTFFQLGNAPDIGPNSVKLDKLLLKALQDDDTALVEYALLSPEMRYHPSLSHITKDPLLIAAEHGNIAIFELFFNNPEIYDKYTYGMLFAKNESDYLLKSCMHGHTQLLHYLFNSSRISQSSRHRFYNSDILFLAANSNNSDMMAYVVHLLNEFKVNIQNWWPQVDNQAISDTCVDMLSSYGNKDVLQHVQSMLTPDHWKKMALTAVHLDKPDLLLYVKDKINLDNLSDDLLRKACSKSNTDMLKLLTQEYFHYKLNEHHFKIVCRYQHLEMLHYIICDYRFPKPVDFAAYATIFLAPLMKILDNLFLKQQLQKDLAHHEPEKKTKL